MQFDISQEQADWLVATRRQFHQIPERGYQEEKTARTICEILDGLKVPYESRIGTTGVVARLKAKREGKRVAYRADMDALPITEAADVPYRSQHPGCMHACGHDGHVTVALGIIRQLVQADWAESGRGEMIFIFQPAEEGGGGAKAMLDSGCFDNDDIGAVYALHMDPGLPAGEVGIIHGPANAATNVLTFNLTGKGGHGAHPDQCRDPIVAGAYLVTQLQTLVSRNIDPLEPVVLTIGQFQAGTACNIIPETAFLDGTLRTLSAEARSMMIGRIEEVVRHHQEVFGVRTEFKNTEGYPVMINWSQPVDHVRQCAGQVLGEENLWKQRPSMGAEDFGYFSERWQGMMLQLGCHDPAKGFQYGLHSPYFDMDERALATGTQVFAHVLTDFLEQ